MLLLWAQFFKLKFLCAVDTNEYSFLDIDGKIFAPYKL